MGILPAKLLLRPQVFNVGSVESDRNKLSNDSFSKKRVITHDNNIANCAEEMADLLSVFGRTGKAGRRSDTYDNDFVTCVLEDNPEEKMHVLIKKISKFTHCSSILNYARQFFPNDGDLFQVLKKMLLIKKLSALQKEKIKEAITDLLCFGDQKRMQSSINMSGVAKRFSECDAKINISAKALRECYLRFLEIALPASFHYNDWIDEFGFRHRKKLLSFIFSALVADMMASEPGIHYHEFGSLSSRLSDARILHTLDQQLMDSFRDLQVNNIFKNCRFDLGEHDILIVYLAGLTKLDEFNFIFESFIRNVTPSFFYTQQAVVVQKIKTIFNLTPVVLFSNDTCRELVIDFLSFQLESLSKRERNQMLSEGKCI